jgi:hypothetical protein
MRHSWQGGRARAMGSGCAPFFAAVRQLSLSCVRECLQSRRIARQGPLFSLRLPGHQQQALGHPLVYEWSALLPGRFGRVLCVLAGLQAVALQLCGGRRPQQGCGPPFW